MGKLPLALLLLIPTLCFSQSSYQSVVEGRTTYYSGMLGVFSDSGQVYVVRIDSVETIANGKQLYQYRQLNNEQPYCLGSSWIGSTIYVLDDGWNVFVSQNNYGYEQDTFQIQTAALPGSTYLFHKFEDNSYLEVTCTGVGYQPVLSGFDSVKTFTLQYKNATGTPVNSPWNLLEIKLTKQSGLLEFYELLGVSPNSVSKRIKLIGFTNPDEGYHPPIAAEIFDFEIGDEFHSSDTQPFWGGYWQNKAERKIVLDKIVSGNGDTVTYKMSVYSIVKKWSNFEYQGATESYDTILQIYPLDRLFPVDSLTYSVQQDTTAYYIDGFHFTVGYNEIFRSEFCLHDVVRLTSYFIELDSSTGCLNDGLCFGACWIYNLSPGLGLVSSYSADYLYQYGHSLAYYKKGNDSCGTPIDFELWLGIDDLASPSSPVVAYPNPASDQIFIQLTQPAQRIELLNGLGRVERHLIPESNFQQPLAIDVHDLSKGIYFLKVCHSDKIFVQKIVVF